MLAHEPLFILKEEKNETIFFLFIRRLSHLAYSTVHSSVQRLISLPNWAHPSRVAPGKMIRTSPLQHQQLGRRRGLFISFTHFQHSHLWLSREKPHRRRYPPCQTMRETSRLTMEKIR